MRHNLALAIGLLLSTSSVVARAQAPAPDAPGDAPVRPANGIIGGLAADAAPPATASPTADAAPPATTRPTAALAPRVEAPPAEPPTHMRNVGLFAGGLGTIAGGGLLMALGVAAVHDGQRSERCPSQAVLSTGATLNCLGSSAAQGFEQGLGYGAAIIGGAAIAGGIAMSIVGGWPVASKTWGPRRESASRAAPARGNVELRVAPRDVALKMTF